MSFPLGDVNRVYRYNPVIATFPRSALSAAIGGYHWVDSIGRPGLGIELAVGELTLFGEYDTLTFRLTTLLPRG